MLDEEDDPYPGGEPALGVLCVGEPSVLLDGGLYEYGGAVPIGAELVGAVPIGAVPVDGE